MDVEGKGEFEDNMSDDYSDQNDSNDEQSLSSAQTGFSGLDQYFNEMPDDVIALKCMVLELYNMCQYANPWLYCYHHRAYHKHSHANHSQLHIRTGKATKDGEETPTTDTELEYIGPADASTNIQDTQTEGRQLKSETTDNCQEKFKTELEVRNERILSLEEEVRALKMAEVQYEKLKVEMSEAVVLINQLQDENKDNEHKLQKSHREQADLKEEIRNLKSACKALVKDCEKLTKAKKLSQVIFEDLKRTLDETKTRLSRLMSQKLTDNNPNVADLSDKNRPTKLAERYSELYDNQWTDAFEVINRETQKGEKYVIGLLQTILYDVLEYCQIGSTEQLNDLMVTLHIDDKTYNSHQQDTVKLLLKDCRKKMAEVGSEIMFARYLQCLTVSERPVDRIAMDVPLYVKECFKICWMMCVQSPPVEIDYHGVRHGDRFNYNVYRAYTKDGHDVDYVVWPAMFLHNGGPVLCKGVAQGMKKQTNKQ